MGKYLYHRGREGSGLVQVRRDLELPEFITLMVDNVSNEVLSSYIF